MKTPLITVVTICKNDLPGLMKTVKSLGNKLRDDLLQWIVVDGFSNDGTKEYLERLRTEHEFETIFSKKHIFGSMNDGLAIARGPIIIFMNSGDSFYDEDVISEIVESYNQNNWVWAVGQANGVNSDGNFLWHWPLPKHNAYRFKFGFRSFCHQATVVQTQVLRNLGGYYEDSIFSDWGATLLLSKKVEPFVHKSIWCNYLAGGVSSKVTANFWANENTKLRIALGIPLFGSKKVDRLLIPLMEYLYRKKYSKFT